MAKGIIFEIQKRKATVMKNNGEFVTVTARSDWKQGDVVTIKEKAAPLKVLAAIAACFLLFISASAVGMGFYFDETAVVSLDVNPSIELSVNRFDWVIGARSLNKEGDAILKQIKVKNSSLDSAVSALFNGGVGDYIQQNPLVTFTVFSANIKDGQVIQGKLQNTADAYVSAHHAEAEIEVLTVDEKVLNEAHEYNVTAGKYAALRELQEVLPEMELESYSHHSISYIKEQTRMHGGNHGEQKGQGQNESTSGGNQHQNKGKRKGSHN